MIIQNGVHSSGSNKKKRQGKERGDDYEVLNKDRKLPY
jgi:hypothetical protein